MDILDKKKKNWFYSLLKIPWSSWRVVMVASVCFKCSRVKTVEHLGRPAKLDIDTTGLHWGGGDRRRCEPDVVAGISRQPPLRVVADHGRQQQAVRLRQGSKLGVIVKGKKLSLVYRGGHYNSLQVKTILGFILVQILLLHFNFSLPPPPRNWKKQWKLRWHCKQFYNGTKN